MRQSTGVPPVQPSQVGFITVASNCWSRNSRKASCLKDRVWLRGSSALSAISLPLTTSGSYVGGAGPETGRVDVLDQMHDTTHHNRDSEDVQLEQYLPTNNASMLAKCYNASIAVVDVSPLVEVGR